MFCATLHAFRRHIAVFLPCATQHFWCFFSAAFLSFLFVGSSIFSSCFAAAFLPFFVVLCIGKLKVCSSAAFLSFCCVFFFLAGCGRGGVAARPGAAAVWQSFQSTDPEDCVGFGPSATSARRLFRPGAERSGVAGELGTALFRKQVQPGEMGIYLLPWFFFSLLCALACARFFCVRIFPLYCFSFHPEHLALSFPVCRKRHLALSFPVSRKKHLALSSLSLEKRRCSEIRWAFGCFHFLFFLVLCSVVLAYLWSFRAPTGS